MCLVKLDRRCQTRHNWPAKGSVLSHWMTLCENRREVINTIFLKDDFLGIFAFIDKTAKKDRKGGRKRGGWHAAKDHGLELRLGSAYMGHTFCQMC